MSGVYPSPGGRQGAIDRREGLKRWPRSALHLGGCAGRAQGSPGRRGVGQTQGGQRGSWWGQRGLGGGTGDGEKSRAGVAWTGEGGEWRGGWGVKGVGGMREPSLGMDAVPP